MVSTARAAIGYATLLLHSAALLSLCTLVVGGGGAIVCTPSPTGGKPKCRICNCVRVRVYDPCSPPVYAVASWQAWGGCSEECARSDAKSIELTTHVMDVPDTGCPNGNVPVMPDAWVSQGGSIPTAGGESVQRRVLMEQTTHFTGTWAETKEIPNGQRG